MAEYCVACSAELKIEKYHLQDKFGKPMQLGRVVKVELKSTMDA